MLKPRNPPPGEPESLSNLFGRAKEDARAWAAAEIALCRTIATEKAKAYQLPLKMLAAALFLGHAALLVAVATLFVALAQVMNPALAGLVSVVILVGAAAIFVKVALGKIKSSSK